MSVRCHTALTFRATERAEMRPVPRRAGFWTVPSGAVERLHSSRDPEDRRESRKAEAAAPFVRPHSLEWASAVGSAAVQRLARQAAPEEDETVEAGPEAAPEAEAPPEAAALQGAGIGHEALAGLGEVDQLGEDALPE